MAKPSPGSCSDLGPSLYPCHPRPVNGYPPRMVAMVPVRMLATIPVPICLSSIMAPCCLSPRQFWFAGVSPVRGRDVKPQGGVTVRCDFCSLPERELGERCGREWLTTGKGQRARIALADEGAPEVGVGMLFLHGPLGVA